MLPSELYRSSVKQLCTQYTPADGVDPDEDFFNYLNSNYSEVKQQISNFSSGNESELIALHNALFVFAVGVFAYGNMDAAYDILINRPTSGHVQRLVFSLKALLPLPEAMDPLLDIDRFKEWLNANQTKLQWKELSGKYEFTETK